MNQKIIIAIIAVVFLIIGGLIGFYIGEPRGYDNGWQAARERLKETGFINPDIDQTEMKIVRGTVESKEGNNIKVKIKPLSPLADPELDIRIVELSDETKIVQLTKIDSDLSSKGYIIKQMEVDINTVEPGQSVLIITKENIRDKKQFKASWITLSPEEEEEIMY